MTSSNIHIMGFKPPMQYDHTLHQLLLAHQIQEDAGLEIEYGSIHYIIGNVWNTLTHNFEPGPGANIIINENITQDDINNINKAHRKDHLSGLIFLLGHKCKSDYNNNNWYRTDIENTIAFDRFTIPHSLTTTQKVNDKPIKYMPPTMRSTLLSNKNTSPHPKNNNKLVKKYDKILGDDTSYSTSQTQEKQHYIPSSERHTCAQTGHKAHRRKFNCNILNNLNTKIQQNVKYNQNINKSVLNTNQPLDILPFKDSIGTPHNEINDAPESHTPLTEAINEKRVHIVPTKHGENVEIKFGDNISIHINEPHEGAIFQLNNHSTVGKLSTAHTKHAMGVTNAAKPHKLSTGNTEYHLISVNNMVLLFSALQLVLISLVLSIPSIKPSLTPNGYVLNDKNKDSLNRRILLNAIITSNDNIAEQS